MGTTIRAALRDAAEAARAAVAADLAEKVVPGVWRVLCRPDKLGPIVVVTYKTRDGDGSALRAWRDGYGSSHGPFRILIEAKTPRGQTPRTTEDPK